MSYKLFLFISIIFLTFKAFSQNLYTYQDLVALEAQSSYREFFAHYKDIRPSLRDKDWKQLVKRMGEAYATEIAKSLSLQSLELKQINMLNAITDLNRDEIFQIRRKTILSRYFTKCFNSKSFNDCYAELQESIDLQSDSKEILYELGEIIRKNFNLQNLQNAPGEIVHVDLWPYFSKSFTDGVAEFYCSEELQKGVIWNKLIEVSQNTPLVNNDFSISSLLHQSCWSKTRLLVSQKFLTGPVFTKAHAYKILLLAKDMTPLEKATNALIYILNSTETGDLLNISWKEVAKLKKDYALREKVVENMKLLDPLPGVIFDSFKNNRLSLVIKYVYENVPEYIDLYSQTCLKYMSSEVIFPNGNPTPYCNELFEMAKGESLIPKPLQERHAKLKNFEF